MTIPYLRPTSDLLDDLRRQVKDRPKLRLHVNPKSAMWIAVSTQNTGLGDHVQVVPDPDVVSAGHGWVEEIPTDRWRAMRNLVGTQVHVDTAELGRLTGTLVELSDDEAIVDLGKDERGHDDRRYVRWISVEAAGA